VGRLRRERLPVSSPDPFGPAFAAFSAAFWSLLIFGGLWIVFALYAAW
jgi:hypothetical protein